MIGYDFFGGCPSGNSCNKGLICGTSYLCSNCSLQECMDRAEMENYHAFSYRSTSLRYCRSCTKLEYENRQKAIDYGLYVQSNLSSRHK